MERILVATDLSARGDRAIERAFLMAGEAGAEVTCLTVPGEEEAGVAAMVETVRDRLTSHLASEVVSRGVAHRIEVRLGRPHQEILRLAAEIDPAVIAMGMHREEGVLDLFRGTTLARVARGGVWPVLLVRDHPDRAYASALVGVDFSEASRRALEAVRRLAPGAERRLAHAYQVPFAGYVAMGGEPGAVVTTAAAREADAAARREMASFVEAVGETAGPPPVIAEGPPDSVLRRLARDAGPDLVALGQHGRPGLVHAILGSTAEDFLREPPCDVLVA